MQDNGLDLISPSTLRLAPPLEALNASMQNTFLFTVFHKWRYEIGTW